MKIKIYFILLIFILLACVTIVLIYNFQDFKEEFSIKHSLSRQDLTYKWRGESIYNIRAQLGILNLTNKGVFSKVYSPNIITGCLLFNSNFGDTKFLEQVTIYLSEKPLVGEETIDTYYNYPIEIKPLDSKIYYLIAYYSQNIPENLLGEFENKIIGINLYELDKKNPNPFNNFNYHSSDFSCNNPGNIKKLSDTIFIRLD